MSQEPGHGDRALPARSEGRAPVEPAPRVYVEPWPAGGWAVRLAGHPVPISRFDTEEEAESRATAYRWGLERAPALDSQP